MTLQPGCAVLDNASPPAELATSHQLTLTPVLPISQIPSLAACTAFVARHMPLEDVFRVPPAAREVDDIESRKTWREPKAKADETAGEDEGGSVQWTAGEIMEARALDRGFREFAA